MKYLNMRWVNAQDGSTKTLRVNDVKNDLTQAEVMAFMEKIATANLLKTSKNSLVDTVDSATIVDTTSSQLFNLVQ
ncbi:MAG: DUF2922 domain-containing protein [Thermotogae bacterium]|jgi:hypothetical protein|nr:DUF2922 domain-containing protein [Thermotogota bacterium]MCL5032785.1 DUF2922 domain-containing protein [Thermotogota bacterium]